MLPGWCTAQGIQPALTPAEACTDQRVTNAIREAIDRANADVSRAESIRSFTVLDTEFSEAAGLLTPKLTVKRTALLTKSADDIARI